jgi:hypothetical protein
VTALVKNNLDAVVPGVRVDFVVTGVNPGNGFAFTDAAGEAEFCYVGNNSGRDDIVASIGTVTATASKDWSTTPNSSTTTTSSTSTIPGSTSTSTSTTTSTTVVEESTTSVPDTSTPEETSTSAPDPGAPNPPTGVGGGQQYPGGPLVRTGSDSRGPVSIAVILVAVGFGLTLIARRRRAASL